MKLKAFRHFGGRNPATASLRKVLAWREVADPHTNRPFSESMLLGIGGGISAGYFAMQHGEQVGFAVGTRHLWNDHLAFLKGLCTRLGILATVREATSPDAAKQNLLETIEVEKPAICWLDAASLSYYGYEPDLRGSMQHLAVVFGHDDARGEAWISDLARKGLRVASAELAEARAAIPSFRNRILSAEPPLELRDLRQAIREGIRACVEGLLEQDLHAFGVRALETWGLTVGNKKLKEGWTKAFRPGPMLLFALSFTYRYIEQLGSGGQGTRGLYADFLEEAAAVLGSDALRDVAAQYRECAELWTGVAKTALHREVPLFKRTRDILTKREQLLHEKGNEATPEIEKLQRRLERAQAEAVDSFPLTQKEANELLSVLSEQILALYEKELAAATALKKTLD